MLSLPTVDQICNGKITRCVLHSWRFSSGNVQVVQMFTGVPECFYDPKKDQMFHSSKSSLVKLLTASNNETSSNNNIPSGGVIVDLAVAIRMVGSVFSTKNATFQDFVVSINQQILSLEKK